MSYISGENHPKAKLTDEQVEDIRTLREATQLTYKEIAEKFGSTERTIQDICLFVRRNTPTIKGRAIMAQVRIRSRK